MRRVQARQVLQFTLWTAHQTARCCLSPAPRHILSPLASSWRCAFTTDRDPLFSYKWVSACLQDLSHPPRDTLPSDCHGSYFWAVEDRSIPRTSCRGGLPMPLPTHLLSTHSSQQLAVTWLLPTSIQNSAGEAMGAKQALKQLCFHTSISQFRNYLLKGITHDWHMNSGCTICCFPTQLMAAKSCMKWGRWQRKGQAASSPSLNYMSRQLARACHLFNTKVLYLKTFWEK